MAVYLGIGNNGTFVTSDGYRLQDVNEMSLTAQPMISKLNVVINGVVYRVNANLKDGEK